MPGVKSGGTGTFNGYEAFAVNQFSTKKEAALSFAREMAGFASQRSIALGENFTALPPSRLSVFEDADVKAKYPLADILFEQAKSNTNRWGAPYFADMSAIYDDVLPKMAKKELTVDAAHTQLVERVQEVIDEYNRS
jgi:ABC-type glycerol-3-phosphate transport system substrate-binding protein